LLFHGLGTTRAVISLDVDAEQVSIIGVFYGGQQYEAMLREAAGNASAY
jgi:toxin ParE1/3/4